jgi:hypothetical protein
MAGAVRTEVYRGNRRKASDTMGASTRKSVTEAPLLRVGPTGV